MATKQATPTHARSSLDLYWKEIMDFQPLSRSEETALFKRIRQGDEAARRAVVQANLRFVVKVAKGKYL